MAKKGFWATAGACVLGGAIWVAEDLSVIILFLKECICMITNIIRLSIEASFQRRQNNTNGCYIARTSRRHYELYKAYLASIYCGQASPHSIGTSDHVRLLCVIEVVSTMAI